MVNKEALMGKLIKGLRVKYGIVILHNVIQYYFENTGEVRNKHEIAIVMEVGEFNARYPQAKKSSGYPYKTTRATLARSFSLWQILQTLLGMWNGLERGQLEPPPPLPEVVPEEEDEYLDGDREQGEVSWEGFDGLDEDDEGEKTKDRTG